MTRRCSHCSNNGHNSRTCPNRAGGVKLFGVRLTDGSIKKSASMGNLSSAHYSSSSSPNPGSPSSDPMNRDQNAATAEGYASDDHAHASCSSNCRTERKKGTPWSEEEHRMFLIGLQKLGKGDWRGISRNYVVSRTPTQVASHAQKYFIRQTNATRRKRRSSLFDMAPDMSIDPMPIEEDQQLPMEDQQFLPSPTPQSETSSTLPSLQSENSSTFPSLHLSLETENEALESTPIQTPTETEESTITQNFQPLVPAFFPAFLTVPYSLWTPNIPFPPEETSEKQHPIVKPIPIHLKRPINIDELVGMSNLTLGEANPGRIEPSSLSVKLLGDPSRQSAFHAKPAGSGGSDLSQKESSVIHAA